MNPAGGSSPTSQWAEDEDIWGETKADLDDRQHSEWLKGIEREKEYQRELNVRCATQECENIVAEEGDTCHDRLALEAEMLRQWKAEKRSEPTPEELCPGGCGRPTKHADGKLCWECRAGALGL